MLFSALLPAVLLVTVCAWTQTGAPASPYSGLAKGLLLESNPNAPVSTNAPAAQSQAPTNSGHHFSTIDFPGASFTQPWDINTRNGIVVGEFLYDDNSYPNSLNGFVFQYGVYAIFNVPGAIRSSARGINSSGQIVGGYRDAANAGHAFLYSRGAFITIDFPGSIGTGAVDINDLGKIVGFFTDGTNVTHGFLYDSAAHTFTTIDPPGSIFTQALGINRYGVIVGVYYDSGAHGHAFLLSGTVFTTLDCPVLSVFTEATGINDYGAIAGDCVDSGGIVDHGFIYSRGAWQFVDVPGAVGTNPAVAETGTALNRIKNTGQLLGIATDGRADNHAEVHGFTSPQ